MTPDLDDALCRDFPSLYRERKLSPLKSCMGRGFTMNDGWEPIVRRLSERLEPLVVGTPICCAQAKEKMGGLSFYLAGPEAPAAVWRAIRQAGREASKMCEDCGAPGRIRPRRNWIQTLCHRCNKAAILRERTPMTAAEKKRAFRAQMHGMITLVEKERAEDGFVEIGWNVEFIRGRA